MDTETAREQELFDAALPLADADERNAFLDRACDGDPGLHARVSQLLAAHTHTDQFFQGCISDFAGAAQDNSPISELASSQKFSEEMVGTWVGRYKLLKTLGAGGCGVVYLAGQKEPVRRRVALKIIKLGMDSPATFDRSWGYRRL